MERKRVNDDAWICDKLEVLIEQYEFNVKKLEKEATKFGGDELMIGMANAFSSVVDDLKELLYEEHE